MIKEFDTLGRHRPIDYDKQLQEVRGRAQNHLKDCKHCLQHKAGFRAQQCGVALQIEGHERVVLEAKRRAGSGES